MDKVGEIYNYVVQPGDYLGKIAQYFNTNVSLIARLNGIQDEDLLQIGQQLYIPVIWMRTFSPMPAVYF